MSGIQSGLAGSVFVSPDWLRSSCGHGSRDESRHANEVVRGGHQICRQLRQLQADEPRSSKATDGFHPSEDLLDSLAFSLADYVTSVTGGALIDGAASTAGVLGQVRCNVAGAQVRHALSRVIALVAGERPWTKASLARLVNKVGHDLAFGSTCRLVDLKVHQQSVAVLHQRMGGVRQVRLLAFALLGQPCLGIGRALMRCVRAALAVEVNRRIARIIRWL